MMSALCRLVLAFATIAFHQYHADAYSIPDDLTPEQQTIVDDIVLSGDQLIDRVDTLVGDFNVTRLEHQADIDDRAFRNAKKITDLMRLLERGDTEVDRTCKKVSPEDCELETRYNRENSEAATEHLSQEIHEIMSYIYTGFIEGLTRVHLDLLKERETMVSQTEYIAHVTQDQFAGVQGMADFFISEEQRLEAKIDYTDTICSEIILDIANAKTSLFENMCFEFEGVTGEITTLDDKVGFYAALGNALDIAYSESGATMKLINIEIIDQIFTGTSYRRALASTGTLSVMIGSSWRCQCENDNPMNDIFRRRMEQQQEQGGVDQHRHLWTSQIEENFRVTVERHLTNVFQDLTSAAIIPCDIFWSV